MSFFKKEPLIIGLFCRKMARKNMASYDPSPPCMSDMTYWNTWHASFKWDTTWHDSFVYKWRDSFKCATRLIQMEMCGWNLILRASIPFEWGVLRIWMSHVTYISMSDVAYIWIGHVPHYYYMRVTHLNESCHTYMNEWRCVCMNWSGGHVPH